MSYVVLARKWRPQQFSDVLGQEHVTQTLTNAITANRVAHAFLFSGPRGVGKTSAARILAKALCCIAGEGPTPTPCGECPQCLEITEGRSTDVFEIDAASHTGVDNVREIIENVRYLPSSARFKIYVIDEVHMLSTGAFNALLKTLEEPPDHVKFVLATTDVHKVPVTILSRVQRHDFRRIPLMRIAQRLSAILESEGADHDPSALALIAREGEGSMRDAQSLMEQVFAYAGSRKLDASLVREALGVVDNALVEEAFEDLVGRRPGRLVELVGAVYDRGLDMQRFGNALAQHARDLLVAKLVQEPGAVLDRPSDEVESLVRAAKSIESIELERLFEQLCRIIEDVGRATHPRFALEVGLAGIAEHPQRLPITDVLSQLSRVEALLEGGGVPRAPKSGGGGSHERNRGPRATARSVTPAPKIEPVATKTVEPVATKIEEPRPAKIEEPAPIHADTMESAASSSRGFTDFVDLVRSKRPSLAATLGQIRPLAFEESSVELGCETRFDEDKLKDQETRVYLEKLLLEFFGKPVSFKVSKGGSSDAPQSISEIEEKARLARHAGKSKEAMERPAVKAIAEELGGSVAKVRVVDD